MQACPYFVASMYGVIGAAFGGVIRDVLCNETPLILVDLEPYATCSLPVRAILDADAL